LDSRAAERAEVRPRETWSPTDGRIDPPDHPQVGSRDRLGLSRILGELKKLGIQSVSRNTVKNILRGNGDDPGPKRGLGTWDEFITIHASTLWQCDFLCKRSLTPKGFRDLFVIVFLHVGSRRVFVSPSTAHPHEAWVTEQANDFLKHVKKSKLPAEVLMHDRDCKFTASFDKTLRNGGLEINRSPYRSPNTCAFVERFIQTIGQECLDYFVCSGRRHFTLLISQFTPHYHEEGPHQGIDNNLPGRKTRRRRPPDESTISTATISCKTRLGGLLKHYYRRAA
jgi:putative transposase